MFKTCNKIRGKVLKIFQKEQNLESRKRKTALSALAFIPPPKKTDVSVRV